MERGENGLECVISLCDTVRAERDRILALAARHDASQVRVIGSVARGTEGSDSDIDFLVTWDPWTSLLDSATLAIEPEQTPGRKVDIASDGWLRPEIRESIYRDALPL